MWLIHNILIYIILCRNNELNLYITIPRSLTLIINYSFFKTVILNLYFTLILDIRKYHNTATATLLMSNAIYFL